MPSLPNTYRAFRDHTDDKSHFSNTNRTFLHILSFIFRLLNRGHMTISLRNTYRTPTEPTEIILMTNHTFRDLSDHPLITISTFPHQPPIYTAWWSLPSPSTANRHHTAAAAWCVRQTACPKTHFRSFTVILTLSFTLLFYFFIISFLVTSPKPL
jgi:hypothetical protein